MPKKAKMNLLGTACVQRTRSYLSSRTTSNYSSRLLRLADSEFSAQTACDL